MRTYYKLHDPSGYYRAARRLDDGSLVVLIGNYTEEIAVNPDDEGRILAMVVAAVDDPYEGWGRDHDLV